MVDTMMTIMQSGEAEFKIDRRDVKAVLLVMLMDFTPSTLLIGFNFYTSKKRETSSIIFTHLVSLDRLIQVCVA